MRLLEDETAGEEMWLGAQAGRLGGRSTDANILMNLISAEAPAPEPSSLPGIYAEQGGPDGR